MDEPKPIEPVDDPEWDGFSRRRWANRFALLFALTFGPSTGLIFASIDIGRYGRGYQVANLVIGIFVLIAIAAGMFLARLLAWRLRANARRAVLITTLALGFAVVAWAWTLHQSGV